MWINWKGLPAWFSKRIGKTGDGGTDRVVASKGADFELIEEPLTIDELLFRKNGEAAVNAKELVELIKSEKPAVLGKTTDKKAARIIRKAFNQLAKQIESTDAGDIRVRGLGRFRIKTIEREKDGQSEKMKRVYFRAKPLQKKAGRAG